MKHVVILAACLAVFLFLCYPFVNPGPFTYDEADYMYAATRGIFANSFDSPSLSLADYVHLGLSSGRDQSQFSAVSVSIRGTGDLFAYRHAHGPVFFYWLNALSHWSTNERFIRTCGMAVPMLTAIAIYFGCLWILPAAQGQIAAILATVLYVCTQPVVRTNEVAPHQMFVFWSILTLILSAKLLQTGSRRVWYVALATTAVAFCTLEVSFVLIAVVAFCGYLERRRLKFDLRLAGLSLAVLAGVVVVIHPAALTKLAFVKSYLFYAYLAVARKSPWGHATLLSTWTARFEASPVEWLLIGAALFAWMRYRKLAGWRQAIPFLLFGVAMIGAMLRVLTTGGRYSLTFLPALLVFAAIVISGFMVAWRPIVRTGAVIAVCAVLLFSSYEYGNAHPFVPDRQLSELLAQVRERNLESGSLLVPHDYLPTLHYYFPGMNLTPYSNDSALPAGRFDAMVRGDDSVPIQLVSPAR